MDIGHRIKQIREAKGLSQSALARKAGITQSAISYIEKGGKQPSLDTLTKIADGLEVDLTFLTTSDSVLNNTQITDPNGNLISWEELNPYKIELPKDPGPIYELLNATVQTARSMMLMSNILMQPDFKVSNRLANDVYKLGSNHWLQLKVLVEAIQAQGIPPEYLDKPDQAKQLLKLIDDAKHILALADFSEPGKVVLNMPELPEQ